MENRILFVLANVKSGGSCISMLNLLEILQLDGYNIDLFLLSHEGLFLTRAKQVSNLLPENLLISSIVSSKDSLFKGLNFKKLIIRVLYVFLHKVFNPKLITDLFYRFSAVKLSNRYDIVVAYQECMTSEYVRFISTSKKIGWVHTDVDRFAGYCDVEEVYRDFDILVGVSKSVTGSISRRISKSKLDTVLIYNSLVSERIISLSNIGVERLIRKDSRLVFVSVGRFVEAKAFKRIVLVAKKLLSLNYVFEWLVVGDGDLWSEINEDVKLNGLQEHIVLIGNVDNPYPYMSYADFLVVTSYYEAHPMVVNESFILKRPVISTSFNSVLEIIDDEVNGLICENSSEGLFTGIKRIFESENLRNDLKKNLKNFVYNNDEISDKVKALLR
jgi:glycosyltransferase involved in cell wall biosynthesis